MHRTWITEQTAKNLSQFDVALVNAEASASNYLSNARAYLSMIGGECNYIDAAKLVSWDLLLKDRARVLDLGCGGGWLAAHLSRFEKVSKVYALDSSRHFLSHLLPDVVTQMNGDAGKIETIEAVFEPLLFADGELDCVVASSAVHHAENLERLLKEIRRTLAPGGYLVLLNETPWPGYRHLISVAAAGFRTLRDLMLETYRPLAPSISSAGYLYDPRLGDRDYPMWYWRKAIEAAGFRLDQVMDSGMTTMKAQKSNARKLKHFICEAV